MGARAGVRCPELGRRDCVDGIAFLPRCSSRRGMPPVAVFTCMLSLSYLFFFFFIRFFRCAGTRFCTGVKEQPQIDK